MKKNVFVVNHSLPFRKLASVDLASNILDRDPCFRSGTIHNIIDLTLGRCRKLYRCR